MRAFAAVAALVFAGLVLPSCSGSGHQAAAGAAGPPTTAAGAQVAWTPCADHPGWDCGTLAVALDHAHPKPTISLALTRHKAAVPAQRVGVMLVNPGGPGASGIQFAEEIAVLPAFGEIFNDFDVIGFDPRGVAASTPIHCVDGPTLDHLNHIDPAPHDQAEITALTDGAKELAAGCAAHSGTLLPHVSTVDAAKDMDDIRVALGERSINYLGFSYGTLLGSTYATLFPTHVRAMMLDAAVDPAIDEGTMSVAQAVGFEQNLNAFLASCSASCAFKLHGEPKLRATFDALMARITSRPIAVGTRSLGPGEALLGVAEPLYTAAQWPTLANALEAAWNGDGSALLALYDVYIGRHADGTYDNSLESNTAINCLDHPAPTSIAAFQALAASAARQAPFFGPPLVWGAIACLYWPVPPVTHPAPIHTPGAPPIVVVGTTGDPATPYAWAQHLAAELDDGVLITRDGDGHGAYLVSQCVRAAVDDYLIHLVKPQALTCAS